MKLDKKQKNYLLVGLCAVVLIMAVGYAAFAQRLTINGTANVTSTWNVLITDIKEKVKSGGNSASAPTHTNTTATFSSTLTKPGDYITYEVTVENQGTIDAKLKTITKTDANNNAIVFTVDGIAENDTLASGATTTFTVKVEYSNSVTTQPSVLTSNLTLQLDYEQNTSSSPSVGPLTPQTSTSIVYAYHTDQKTIGTSQVTDGVSDYTQLSSWLNGKTWFLKYELDGNNVIQNAWVCQKYTFINEPVCLQGGNSSYYGTSSTGNRGILEGLASTFSSNGGYCNVNDSSGSCSTDSHSGLEVSANSNGYVSFIDYSTYGNCVVTDNGLALCL